MFYVSRGRAVPLARTGNASAVRLIHHKLGYKVAKNKQKRRRARQGWPACRTDARKVCFGGCRASPSFALERTCNALLTWREQIFRALPASSLGHELFESTEPGRVEVDRPLMNPMELGTGVLTRFDDKDPTAPMSAFGVPKHMLLEFRILGAPCSVTTTTTLSLVRALEESKTRPAHVVLNGREGSGKSFLLLQAAQYASASRSWITIYVPRARTLVDGSTPYSYSLSTQTYLQPRAARVLLQRIGRANAHLLPHMRMSSTATFSADGGTAVTVREGQPLTALIENGSLEDGLHAHAALERLLEEWGNRRSIRADCDPLFPVSDQLADSLRRSPEFGPSPRSVRYRRSTQLASYLENTIEAPMPKELDPNVSEVEMHAADLWSGWLAFDPPLTSGRTWLLPKVNNRKTSLAGPLRHRGRRPRRRWQTEEEPAQAKKVQAIPPVKALRAIRVPSTISIREAAALFELWLDAGVLRTGGERRVGRRADLMMLDGFRKMKENPEATFRAMESEFGSATTAKADEPASRATGTRVGTAAVDGKESGDCKPSPRCGRGFVESGMAAGTAQLLENAFEATEWSERKAAESKTMISFDEDESSVVVDPSEGSVSTSARESADGQTERGKEEDISITDLLAMAKGTDQLNLGTALRLQSCSRPVCGM
ncbi:unnamed protein product [Mycena citricolor]|uniref:Small ribosomal subunit protein mS29 n=1 Tax=Mycena citricolor TaxID=2018698 RepID=A0AAD2HX08_9AGAR|nr:unnamed protein product [Mycena citricolor]